MMMMIFVLLMFVSSWSGSAAPPPKPFPLTLVKLHTSSLKQLSTTLLSYDDDDIAPTPSRPPSSYTMVLIVTIPGTPTQSMAMVMDTGSQLSWVTCATGSSNTSTAHMFRPKKSKSFENYFCNKNSDCVISDVDTSVMNCSDYYHGSKLCNFTYSYADGFTANGFLVKETVDSHPAILLGCTTLLDSTGAQGLMGMNLGSLSFPTQAGITKFSYCISSNSSRGKFYLGTNPYDGFRYLNLLEISPGIPTLDSLAYTVLLNCIRFGNNNTQIQVKASDPMIDESDSNGIMIDSATQYSFLLPNTYADLREKVDNLTKGFNMTGVDYSQAFDMCYPVGTDPNAVAAAIGDLVFDFGSKVTITVPKERVLDRINDKTCVAIGKSALLSSMTGVHTLGISYQKCHWVEYDSYNRRVGFREIGPSREHQNITCG